jgi:hypothetical protein
MQCHGEKSLVLSVGLFTRDQEQVVKSCLPPSKVYNRGTPSIGLILAMNAYHERNGKPPLC